MQRLLLVAKVESMVEIRAALAREGFRAATCATSAAQARRLLQAQAFCLCVIAAPLGDDFGDTLALAAAATGATQALLLVHPNLYATLSARMAGQGVFVLPLRPNPAVLAATLAVMRTCHSRLKPMHEENRRLEKKLSDAQLIHRAKCYLMEHEHLSEDQAHKYLERQAMDHRLSRQAVAARVLGTHINKGE